MHRIPILILSAALFVACGASQGNVHEYSPPPEQSHAPAPAYQFDDASSEAMVVAESRQRFAPAPARTQAPSAVDRHAVTSVSQRRADAPAQATPPEVEAEPQRGQLLIYSGAIILAIYEVAETQDRAVEYVEEIGGYISRRATHSLTIRVPAPRFREAMESLGSLGDVLDRSWEAQDVTDEVRDLDIRLNNAMDLRDRLRALIEEAKTVEDALKIETELERITLEIERIKGMLKSFEDRIAYSTIEVTFRSKGSETVPADDFLLPFRWLNTLGLESLLRSPRMYR